MCKESGLKALSGGYNDFRDVEEQAAKGNSRAKLALEVLAHQARHWIGSFLLQLNGADALVFTAGIGENRAAFRSAVCANLDQLGIVLDPELNKATKGHEAVISAPNSRVKVLVIPTNEELVVAREVKRFLEKPAAEPNPASGHKSQLTNHAIRNTQHVLNHQPSTN
jgi:acetate kinase